MPSHRFRRDRLIARTTAMFAIAGVLLLPVFAEGAGAPAAKPAARPAAAPGATGQQALARERERIDATVGAALVGALGEELGGRTVRIQLDDVTVQTTSLRDRMVTGRGRLQIENDEAWMGFGFTLLYDAVMDSAGYPELRIGEGGSDGRAVPNDAQLVRELDDRVVDLLAQEFGYQNVRLQLDRISTVQAAQRYLRIEATGIADFGLDGAAPTRVDALYDPTRNAWLRVAYKLQPSTVGSEPSPAVGQR